MNARHAHRLARAAFSVAKGLERLVPAALRTAVEDRVFYAVHQLTRITNDDYVSDQVRDRSRSRRSPTG